MARARNIKHGFFTNDQLAEMPALGRLLFIGLWTIADREGRLEDRPKKIKAEVLPYDQCNVDSLLTELHERGFITRYAVEDKAFIQINNFSKHQNPHVKEAASTIPAPCKPDTSTIQAEKSTERATLIVDCGLLIEDSGAKPARKRAAHKTRMPDDFAISERVRAWAAARSIFNLEQHFDHFVSKAKAKGYTYADWDEGFMGAVREDWAKIGKGNPPGELRAAV